MSNGLWQRQIARPFPAISFWASHALGTKQEYRHVSSAAALLEKREAGRAALALTRGATLSPLQPLGRGERDFARLFASLPAHAAHEISPAGPGEGTAAAGFVAGLAALWSKGPIVWEREAAVRAEEGELYPPGLVALGLDLSRLLIVDAKKRSEALWATEEALKIPGAVAIAEIGPNGAALDLVATRRFSLSAAEHKSTALILSHLRGRGPSSAWTRWTIASAPSFALGRELGAASFRADLKRMRNALGERRWTLEWSPHARQFTDISLGGDLAQRAIDRPFDPRRTSTG
jgi:protein ImuA